LTALFFDGFVAINCPPLDLRLKGARIPSIADEVETVT